MCLAGVIYQVYLYVTLWTQPLPQQPKAKPASLGRHSNLYLLIIDIFSRQVPNKLNSVIQSVRPCQMLRSVAITSFAHLSLASPIAGTTIPRNGSLRKLVLSGNRIGGVVACARALRNIISQTGCCLEVYASPKLCVSKLALYLPRIESPASIIGALGRFLARRLPAEPAC